MISVYIVEAYLGEASLSFNLKKQVSGAASKNSKGLS